ncbi:Cobalt-precorrin-8 methylmutase [Candidatus Magnetomoraceae bacterium gMMP-13]
MKRGSIVKPDEIERLSFKIIDKEAGSHNFSYKEWSILRRIIHTSADFEYMDTIRFHSDAVKAGINAICSGKPIITDTQMARAGIRKKELEQFGSIVKCLISDPYVAKKAINSGITRAKAAVDKAVHLIQGGIYVVGNAPTALFEIIKLSQEKKADPALIIGLPVGFVNAAESKAALIKSDIPFISNIGRKGGSNIAASVVNALIIMAKNKEETNE